MLPPTGRPLVVAVDGPSGSGKSSVARRVAVALGLHYLDTGAMYRAVTWRALDLGMDLRDQAAVAALARRLQLEVSTDPDAPSVVVDGHDVTRAIRQTRISEAVSAVATNLGVREELVRRQRAAVRAASPGVVAEGRDTTTVVAPDADVRILLTAAAAERIARRARQVHGSDDAGARAATAASIVTRDARDSTVVEFATAATGVTLLDSSALDLDATVAAVLALVEQRTGAVPTR